MAMSVQTNQAALLESGPQKVSPLAVPLMMSNAGAAARSLRHNLRGQVYSVASACAAGRISTSASPPRPRSWLGSVKPTRT